MRVLVIEDEYKIANAIKKGLAAEGYAVDVAYNGDDGLASALNDPCDKKQSDREAMKAWRDANPNATRAEMKAQHDKLEADFSQWAKDQGIDLTKVQAALKSADIGRGGKRGGMRHDGGMHDNGAPLE